MLKDAGSNLGRVVDSAGDGLQSLRAVVDGVHGCDVGEQGLGSADVGSRLLPSNVLLSGLQGHAVGKLIVGIDRAPDYPSWHLPHVLLAGGEKSRVWSSEAHGHSEPLC